MTISNNSRVSKKTLIIYQLYITALRETGAQLFYHLTLPASRYQI